MARSKSCRDTIALVFMLLSVDSCTGDTSTGSVRGGGVRRNLTTLYRPRKRMAVLMNHQEDETFWNHLTTIDSSLSSETPSSVPSLDPSPVPVTVPTAGPTTEESTTTETPVSTSKPSSVPTGAPTTTKPSSVPTGAPTTTKPSSVPTEIPTTATPSSAPSETPSSVPTPLPSAVPTIVVTPMPSGSPTISPSAEPSQGPTETVCAVALNLRCLANDLITECENIAPEENLVCECTDCTRELVFMFTANACDEVDVLSGQCADIAAVTSPARVLVTVGEATLFDGTVEIGDSIDISPLDGECLSETLSVAVLSPDSDSVMQTIQLDGTCNEPDGLTLLNSYGAFDFMGYSCNATDVHNCMVDVTYLLATCNDDLTQELILYELEFDVNGDRNDLLSGNSPRFLDPNECLQSFIQSSVERCSGQEYVAMASLNASNSFTGLYCLHETELTFDTFSNFTNSSI